MDSKADVVFLIDTLGAGGAEMNFVNMANCLSKRGLKCKLVLCRKLGPLTELVDSRVEIILLQDSKEIFISTPKFIGFLKKIRPKIVFSAFLQVNVIAVVSKILSGVGCKVFVSEHSIFSIANSKENVVSRRQYAFPFLAKLFYPLSDGVVAVSKDVQADIADVCRMPVQNVHVINNPVRLSEDIYKEKKPRAKMEKSVFHVVACGRLTPVKDFYTLLRALHYVRESLDVRLKILGEGVERQKLEAFVEKFGLNEFVSFLGHVDDPFPHFMSADLFVLSSKYEGFGNVIVEAMSCGLPVVSTDCPGGPREILVDGKYGALVPVGNSKKMAEAIEHSLFNPIDPTLLVKRSRDFDIDLICDEYLNLFELG